VEYCMDAAVRTAVVSALRSLQKDDDP